MFKRGRNEREDHRLNVVYEMLHHLEVIYPRHQLPPLSAQSPVGNNIRRVLLDLVVDPLRKEDKLNFALNPVLKTWMKLEKLAGICRGYEDVYRIWEIEDSD